MEVTVKTFHELSLQQLFELYRLRSAVFVVEQNCPYQDVDDKDLYAHHVLMTDEKELIGYCRILPPGVSYKEPSIGRVLVIKEQRGNGSGQELMKYSINKTLELFNNQQIVISAQVYLLKFYTDLGFKAEGEIYPEDDIPHIKMRYVPSQLLSSPPLT